MKEVRTRDAGEEDWFDLERIFYSNRSGATAWLNPARPKDDLREQSEGEKILVAQICGKVLGFVSIWEPENFIHHLYIDKEYQGKGIGRTLVLEVQRRFPGPLRLKCGERNQKAIKFYLESGWKEVGRGESEDGPYLLLELPCAGQASGSEDVP